MYVVGEAQLQGPLAIAGHEPLILDLAGRDDAKSAPALDDEAEPLVELPGKLDLDEHSQLHATRQQPVVRQIEQRRDQPGADAARAWWPRATYTKRCPLCRSRPRPTWRPATPATAPPTSATI